MTASEAVLTLLRERGAESIEHPGGTLYAHLIRVYERLAGHGADPELQFAGLAHAAYGTDGFDVALFDRHDRTPLQALVGSAAEQLIYRYGGCDRSRSWSDLAQTKQVWNRFDDSVETLAPAELRAFVDLSIVNELDVVEQSAAMAEKYGDYFGRLWADWRPLASPQVMVDADAVLAGLPQRR
jgi:uncharacterized protein DUF6817